MAQRQSGPKPQSQRKYSRLRSVEAEEIWRTGHKTPGSLERAFNKLYPNRNYSTQFGPVTEEE